MARRSYLRERKENEKDVNYQSLRSYYNRQALINSKKNVNIL